MFKTKVTKEYLFCGLNYFIHLTKRVYEKGRIIGSKYSNNYL